MECCSIKPRPSTFYAAAFYAHVALLLACLAAAPRSAAEEASLSSVPPTRAIVPSVRIVGYHVSGNSILSEQAIESALRDGLGEQVTTTQIRVALGKLRQAYREQGLSNASVLMPRQVMTNGLVFVQVTEGQNLASTKPVFESTRPAEEAPSPAPPRTFEVARYEVQGNTLLQAEAIDTILRQATGKTVSLAQIQSALGQLQLAYRERGYATVGVGLPQQQLTNATVKVQVTEGLVTDIRVKGNRHYSSNNVRRALPSLRTNILLNDRIFQRELDLANESRDRQIYPTLGPGPDPGTSAVTLQVKDRLPLHARIDIDNYSTPGTPEWRINSSAQYNNLWQLEHQVGLSYGFSPEQLKSEGLVSDYLFNQPLVAYYGAYYRMPFGSAESIQDRINNSTGFGYNEATHQFRLPPAGARPDLTIFASAASSDTGVKYGVPSIVSQTPLLTIVSRDSGQNLSLNEGVVARVSFPIALDDRQRLNFSAGPDFKRYRLESFNTNNFIITTVVTNAQGSQTIESIVSSPQPARDQQVDYFPLSLEAGYLENDTSGTLSASLGLTANFAGDSKDFNALAYSRKAEAAWARANLSVSREQKLFGSWSLLLRGAGQVATGPLISNEQFALGGINSVRGYDEGTQYGDSGWFGSAELRSPQILSYVPTWLEETRVWLRGTVFIDGGQRYLLDERSAAEPLSSLCGTGVGLNANLNNHFDLRLAVGWPLLNADNVRAGQPRAYFSMGGQF